MVEWSFINRVVECHLYDSNWGFTIYFFFADNCFTLFSCRTILYDNKERRRRRRRRRIKRITFLVLIKSPPPLPSPSPNPFVYQTVEKKALWQQQYTVRNSSFVILYQPGKQIPRKAVYETHFFLSSISVWPKKCTTRPTLNKSSQVSFQWYILYILIKPYAVGVMIQTESGPATPTPPPNLFRNYTFYHKSPQQPPSFLQIRPNSGF